MTVDVRPSDISDFPAGDALLSRSYPKLLTADYLPSVLVTALPLISRAQPKLLTCGTYYVAQEAGRTLGAGEWTPDRARSGLGHIRHLVTDDRVLRRGVGRAILDHILAEAKMAGVTELECWSTRTAVGFYTAVGFLSEGAMCFPLAPGIAFPAVRMRCHLP